MSESIDLDHLEVVLKRAVESAMVNHPVIAEDAHQDDHEWVQKKRDWEARKGLRVERIKDSLITWGLQGIALAVFSACIYYLTGGVRGG